MTTIANCASVEQAEVLCSLLADCGIKAYLPDELSVTYRGVLGGIRVQVADEEEASARKVLAAERLPDGPARGRARDGTPEGLT